MKKYLGIVLLAFIGVVSISAMMHPENVLVPYPEGYRKWAHVKTAINGPGAPVTHQGFHHIYANDKALEGYRSGKFADGSMIVFDVIESLQQPNGDVTEGKRKLVDVMVKDAQRYDSTGGWGFEEFNESSISDRKILHLARQRCFNCHARQQQKDFVFSGYRN
jgi:hypothetical protein